MTRTDGQENVPVIALNVAGCGAQITGIRGRVTGEGTTNTEMAATNGWQ